MPQLEDIIAALSDPAIYPDPAPAVALEQTQMSVVFLAGDYVYKVKKPVNLGYLDYTTLEQRLEFCRKEVDLNRRLCPHAYLGVVAITIKDGRLSLGGSGKVVEYAVKMRRLPGERMMDVLLGEGRVSVEMVRRLAATLADFHARAAVVSGFGDITTIRTNTEENFQQVRDYVGRTLPPARYDRIASYTRRFIQHEAARLQQRVAEGRVRDCHGDLHTAHVCFTDPVCIFDCIEFNDRFRYVDVAGEVAFLSMDIDRLGRSDLADAFVKAYIEHSGDTGLAGLLNFYKCYFAFVRGKVAGFKLDDPLVPEDERAEALALAQRYFELAEAYTR